ncbi:Os07g0200900 [Oryza sativa Japonica Group]|uniref:Os07g0200900 protein n=1 Tax=Oryza sativa subsp. japonica TaxID=39947 RepID=C7J571_ORYSJ|nr:Os07g0200900 [Oryza sativa Japonica Group]|eukprot:NP_001175094.1 Os07g0200900 [Oryza sativa Japonica Group]
MGFLGFLWRRATATACASSERRGWPTLAAGDGLAGVTSARVQQRWPSPALIRHRRWEFETELTSMAVGRPDWSPAMEAWWRIVRP